jgi:hypothetical protein
VRERRRVWVTEEDLPMKKARYDNHVNFLIQNVIMRQDNLFKKKMIAFVLNESSVHWTATFVFNPSCIREDANTNSRPDLRSCFYRYCGKLKSGVTLEPPMEIATLKHTTKGLFHWFCIQHFDFFSLRIGPNWESLLQPLQGKI